MNCLIRKKNGLKNRSIYTGESGLSSIEHYACFQFVDEWHDRVQNVEDVRLNQFLLSNERKWRLQQDNHVRVIVEQFDDF